MDPSPKSFPILSYVMSRLPSIVGRRSETPVERDIEQPPVDDSHRRPLEAVELVERMPRLNNPELLAAMVASVSDVAQTRSVLQTLGERPDHEAVDDARARIAEIDAALARDLEEIVRAPRPEEADRLQWRAEREKECRARSERERRAYKAVIQLDEMHEAYDNLLKDAEERLVKIYRSAEAAGGGADGSRAPAARGEDEPVNEEVIRILQEASGKCPERVDLSDRRMRYLPEDFGKLHGMVSLNLSNNQLEVSYGSWEEKGEKYGQ